MRINNTVAAVAICAILVLAVGCTQSRENRPPAESATSNDDQGNTATNVPADPGTSTALSNGDADGGLIALPEMWRLPGLAGVESATSWDSRVAKFPVDDQAYLKEISDRYFGVLAFQSEDEQRLLVRQGFPMPEEWLAARNLHDAELERLAKEGNSKAQMLQIDRVGARIAPILGAGSGLDVSGNAADREQFHRYVAVTSMARDLLGRTKSPFAAYLYGYVSSAGSQWNPPEPIASSFLLARDLGDHRADELREAFVQQHPGMRAEGVLASYSSMRELIKP